MRLECHFVYSGYLVEHSVVGPLVPAPLNLIIFAWKRSRFGLCMTHFSSFLSDQLFFICLIRILIYHKQIEYDFCFNITDFYELSFYWSGLNCNSYCSHPSPSLQRDCGASIPALGLGRAHSLCGEGGHLPSHAYAPNPEAGGQAEWSDSQSVLIR